MSLYQTPQTISTSTGGSISIMRPIASYQRRAIVEFGNMSLYFNHQHIMLLLPNCKTGEIPSDALRLPLPSNFPPVFLSAHTFVDSMARAIGLQTYDLALPYSWVESEYLSRGLPFPRGCWCYDDNRVFGEFVSLDTMIARLADALVSFGADALFDLDSPIAPGEDLDSNVLDWLFDTLGITARDYSTSTAQ